MSKKRDVTMFVDEVFDLYGISKFEFFYDSDGEGNEFEIPLFPHYRIDEKTLDRISIKLGLTKDEIMNRDMVAAKKYWNKYPFFRLYSEYLSQWSWDSRYNQEKPSVEDMFFHMIFKTGEKYPAKERYNYQDVKSRMIEQIKEFDEVIPGTYHKDAQITEAIFETEVFMSFPQVTEMLKSFVDMVDYIKKKFFKAVHVGLENEEINEYNFLVNWLYATDAVMPGVLVTYDNICTYRTAYLEETYEDFYSYVRIKKLVSTDPWRCKEFFNDMELVEKFIDVFPESKAKMREFAMSVSQFYCSFLWSDSDEYMQIYVPKKQEEMFDWVPYVEKLNQITKPVAKGGIEVRERSLCTLLPESFPRMQRRVEVKNGGNN